MWKMLKKQDLDRNEMNIYEIAQKKDGMKRQTFFVYMI